MNSSPKHLGQSTNIGIKKKEAFFVNICLRICVLIQVGSNDIYIKMSVFD